MKHARFTETEAIAIAGRDHAPLIATCYDEAHCAQRAGHTGWTVITANIATFIIGQLCGATRIAIAAREGNQYFYPLWLPVDIDEGNLVQR